MKPTMRAVAVAVAGVLAVAHEAGAVTLVPGATGHGATPPSSAPRPGSGGGGSSGGSGIAGGGGSGSGITGGGGGGGGGSGSGGGGGGSGSGGGGGGSGSGITGGGTGSGGGITGGTGNGLGSGIGGGGGSGFPPAWPPGDLTLVMKSPAPPTIDAVTVRSLPEPGTLVLLATALAAAAGVKRRPAR